MMKTLSRQTDIQGGPKTGLFLKVYNSSVYDNVERHSIGSKYSACCQD